MHIQYKVIHLYTLFILYMLAGFTVERHHSIEPVVCFNNTFTYSRRQSLLRSKRRSIKYDLVSCFILEGFLFILATDSHILLQNDQTHTVSSTNCYKLTAKRVRTDLTEVHLFFKNVMKHRQIHQLTNHSILVS